MDQIRIDNLCVFAHHGVYAFETKQGQNFYVNAVLDTDLETAGYSDDLEDSTNYGEICEFISDFLQDNTCQLIEAAAQQTAVELLLQFPKIQGVELELRKPDAPINLPFESVSVKINRSWHDVYLSFGSNMGEKERYIHEGLEKLKSNRMCRIEKISDLIVTKPYGGVKQEDFLNGACYLKTLLSPRELLKLLHKIEAEAGRKREVHWGPRTLDLDILFYDKLVLENETLVIPHMDLENREFVLIPMEQLAPSLRHPVTGLTISRMGEQLRKKHQEKD